jgi:hypothetical protein
VGLVRVGLDRYGKSRPLPEFDSRTVQPVASRYTDCAIPARDELNLVVCIIYKIDAEFGGGGVVLLHRLK